MKGIASIATACVLAAALMTGCATSLSGINRARFGPMTLDDGHGIQAYLGGALPRSAEGSLKIYRFTVPFDLPDPSFRTWPCLVIGPSAFPYKLYMNGQLMHRYGEDGDQDRTRMYSSSMVTLPAEALRAKGNMIEVEAQVGSERNPLMDLGIADSRDGSSYVYWRNFFMSQLAAGGFTVGLLLLVYFLSMYVLGKGMDRRYLWFALFCGFFAMANVNIVFNHQATSDAILTKIGRVGFFACVTMLSYYVMETTSILARRRWVKAVMLAAAAIASAWVVSQGGLAATNAAFHLATQLVITPNLVFCVALVILASARKGFRPYAILCLGFVGAIAASLYDMSFDSRDAIPYAWVLVYGYEWLVVCVFLELAFKQERVSRIARSQAEDLNEKNEILRSVFQHLRAGSESLAASTEELAVSTREVSVTGNQQAAAVREIVATMEDSNALLNRISQMSSSVHRDSESTAQRAEEGVANVKTALEKLEAVIGRISESISMISDFNEQLGSITEIVKIIDGIATHIRIIAFNASLEAVAAGEAGKNFRIVAEEVKRLADSTMASVKSIRERVGALISTSDNVVKVARQGYVSLEQSWDIASGIGTSFSGIVEGAESSARSTADIDSSIQEENTAFKQIVLVLKEISAGVNNFVNSATQTSETTRRLNDIAEQLHGLIVQYSGDAATGEGGASS
jgi:methyl-accepting chemotaxis protein